MHTTKLVCVILLLTVATLLIAGCGAAKTSTPAPVPTSPVPTSPVKPTPQILGTAQQSKNPQASTELAMTYVKRQPGALLARVNGAEIHWEEFEVMLRQSLFTINSQHDIDWADGAMQQRLTHVQNDVLKQAADQVLLRQIAQQKGVSVDPAQIQAQVEGEKASILNSGRYADWDAFLSANGLTDETFQSTIADTLLLNALLAAQQVDTQAEQVHLRHIVVARQEEAANIVSKLKAGEDFAALAAQYSLDTETKNDGGDLGWFIPENIITDLKDAALSLPPGGFSDPIPTRGGYAVVQVVERGLHELEPTVQRQRQQQALAALLDTVRAEAQIEYLVDFTATPAP